VFWRDCRHQLDRIPIGIFGEQPAPSDPCKVLKHGLATMRHKPLLGRALIFGRNGKGNMVER
jgi:hypothetical protein